MRKAWILINSVLFVFGCSSNRGRVDKTVENGVEIVLNHLEPYQIKGEPSTFSLEKLLSIDLERADLAKAGMGTAGEWDADDQGNIYVVCFKNQRDFIYRFDRTGHLTSSFGRRGQGPGELQWPFLSGVSSFDQIAFTDYMDKFIVYDLNGKVVQEIKLRHSALHIDPLKNGKYLVFGPRRDLSTSVAYVDDLTLCDANMEVIKILDRYENAADNARQVPFFMWRVSGDRILIANQARGYEIWVYDLDGNFVRKIRREYRPVKVTEAIKDAVLGPSYRRSGISQDKYFSDPLPPLNQFFADDEGRIFVMTYEPGPKPGEYIWDIFNPDGEFVGRKALNLVWAGLFLGPHYTFVKKGLFYCHQEKENGFHELVVYKMIWE
jgi:hypothetical protein